ncbi:MAG: endopeptidase La [Bacteroidales bacterium]|jgi:ATP-dependent Lon protease|nr:endopeptidase La [Bacteroidales bacterium]
MNEELNFFPFLPENEEVEGTQPLPELLEIMPWKNQVLFPGITMPVTIRRASSKKLVKEALDKNFPIGIVTMLERDKEGDPHPEDLYSIGTMANVLQVINVPDNEEVTVAVVRGLKSFKADEYFLNDDLISARTSDVPKSEKLLQTPENEALIASIKDLSSQTFQKTIPNSRPVIGIIHNVSNPLYLLYFILSILEADTVEKQKILEMGSVLEKANSVLQLLTMLHQKAELKQQIQGKAQSAMDKQYREHVLNEQLKTIQQELGGTQVENDVKELREKSKDKKWHKEVADTFDKELKKLQRMNSMSPDYSIQLSYLENIVDLPWNEYSQDNFDMKYAQQVLDEDHFGLEKVKQRIIEYLAVLKLKDNLKAPILCLLGPPGVGKTSLGRSLARAISRKYIRISLGGLHDEAEIRGHRRTYIGAMPGRIISSIKKAGTANPVFVLDEIDKVSGMNVQGDAQAALLEVLDPEQNTAFHDNFLDIDFDLSKVMFVSTANTLQSISPALLDRMEVIDISGYFLEEKLQIAKCHLLPKQLHEHGVSSDMLSMDDKIITKVIDKYTRESGVRQLEKSIAKIVRHRARQIVENQEFNTEIQADDLYSILGIVKFEHSEHLPEDMLGVVTGLAWTAVGGEILFIEAVLNPGNGQLTMTGNLGNVMKESANLAYEFMKSQTAELGIQPEIFEKHNIHVHVPEGATPKDGPSAGIAMLTVISSVLLHKKIRSDIAMTGEITLRGKVLPIGGIKEKVLAAKRAGINEIIICNDNRQHVEEIENQYISDMKFHYIENMLDVLKIALDN